MGLPAPSAEIDIINMALDRMGAAPITATTQLPFGPLMARHYAASRQQMLRQFVWHFAEAQATITRIRTPLFGFADEYQLPPDFIRYLRVVTETSLYGVVNVGSYRIYGRSLLMNALAWNATPPGAGSPTVNLEYIKDEVDVTLWDPLFINLVVLTLGVATAFQVTKKQGVVQMLNGLLSTEIPAAISINGQERPPIKIQHSRGIAMRRLNQSGMWAGPIQIVD